MCGSMDHGGVEIGNNVCARAGREVTVESAPNGASRDRIHAVMPLSHWYFSLSLSLPPSLLLVCGRVVSEVSPFLSIEWCVAPIILSLARSLSPFSPLVTLGTIRGIAISAKEKKFSVLLSLAFSLLSYVLLFIAPVDARFTREESKKKRGEVAMFASLSSIFPFAADVSL